MFNVCAPITVRNQNIKKEREKKRNKKKSTSKFFFFFFFFFVKNGKLRELFFNSPNKYDDGSDQCRDHKQMI